MNNYYYNACYESLFRENNVLLVYGYNLLFDHFFVAWCYNLTRIGSPDENMKKKKTVLIAPKNTNSNAMF